MDQSHNAMDVLNIKLTSNEDEQQLIIFSIANEDFGLSVLCVQEIIRHIQPTKIPKAPYFVEGVIDFRGEIIPVVNLREKLGIPTEENDNNNVIIIIEVNEKIMGLTVDFVSDIINIPKEKIHQASEITDNKRTEYLKAMGKLGDRLILILDLNKIMDMNQHKSLEKILSSVE